MAWEEWLLPVGLARITNNFDSLIVKKIQS
jgi:hypothetical protein